MALLSASTRRRHPGYARENRAALLAQSFASTHMKALTLQPSNPPTPPPPVPMAGLGMQVREAPLCLLPLELKEHPDRWTTSTGPPAALFIWELSNTISYSYYRCRDRDDRGDQKKKQFLRDVYHF